MRFVLDCSVTMSWCFSDEVNDFADAVLDFIAESEALAPVIWPLEVSNVMLVAERRGRISKAQLMRLVELLGALPVTVDISTSERAMGAILAVAREQRLSVYDAAYLELAMREGSPIASLDEQLKTAAERCGVPLLKAEKNKS